ncbi:MAG TPA: PAS domain S-box protein, partial [Geothrix sp.]
MPADPVLPPFALPSTPSLEAQLDSARAEADHYRALVEHFKDVIYQIDRQGQWSFLNPAWTELTGFPAEECLGRPFLGYLHPADNPRYLNMLTYAVDTAQTDFEGEFRIPTKGGDVRWVEAHQRIAFDTAGVVLGVSGTLNDITERKH